MIEVKTKDGDTLIMFRGYRGRFKIISCNRGKFVARNSVVFCKKTNQSERSFEIIGDKPKVGLFFIAYKYEKGEITYSFVSKEITEVLEYGAPYETNQST